MSVGPHLTREEISEAAEGLLPATRQRSAEAHLAGCEECRTGRDEIADVRARLRGIGEHRPAMPDQVADRLLAAITAEARRPRSVPAAVPVTEPMTEPMTEEHAGTRHAGGGRPRRRTGRARMAAGASRALAAAAAVAAVAVGGTLGYQQLVADRSPSPMETNAERSSGPRKTGERSPEPSRPVYAIVGAPELNSQRFRDDVAKAIRPASEAPKPPSDGPGPMRMMGDCPGNTVAQAGGGVVLDQANATFDGGPADLVITRSPVPGAVEAYVVTGCPKTGVVAHRQTIRLSR